MEFEQVQWAPACLSSTDGKQMLLQWNLDKTLSICRFRYSGGHMRTSEEYMQGILEFLKHASAYGIMGVYGTMEEMKTNSPPGIEELGLTQLSMDMFNKLEPDIVSPSGTIRGCFEERYNDITINDKLREMLVNEDSENSTLFAYSEQRELLFQIFKCLVVGGCLCQCEDRITRYLDTTKALYKELLTVYKNATTDQPEISGRAFLIKSIPGLDLYGDASSIGNTDNSTAENMFIVLVDPSKRQLTVVKKVMISLW